MKRLAEIKFLVFLYLSFGVPLIALAAFTHVVVSGGFA